ncbi:toxin TcdB middle/N-terminal domain-containing protein [Pendulispora albinea]|uniref:Insecticide toxin TcdB middle/N-terminal domain-containing protein n=1 Tax=Pendulispora albinea TaxID=2741071 RepID=A0ABZ2LMH6_9BACT
MDAAEGSGVGNVAAAGTEPSTGTAHAAIPFRLPRARGGVQPQLGLNYSSTAGIGEVGFGWSLGLTRIERHNISNGPRYKDPRNGEPIDPAVADRFDFNGSPLVPICLIAFGKCTNGAALQPGEEFPVWTTGWMYYRPQIEGAFTRFFWSPDHRRWIAQAKGAELELGVPRGDENNENAVDLDRHANNAIYRWNIVRQRDANGSANVIVYDWTKFPETDEWITDDLAYLTDIYTSPKAGGDNPPRDSFAHHTHLTYQSIRHNYASKPAKRDTVVWRRIRQWMLARVDTTSSNFLATSPRSLVRQYLLYYEWGHKSQARWFLQSVYENGACSGAQEDASGTVPPNLPPGCGAMRPIATMSYWGDGMVSTSPPVTSISYFAPGGLDTTKPIAFVDMDGDGLGDAIGYSRDNGGMVMGSRLGAPNRPLGKAMDILHTDFDVGNADVQKRLLFHNAMLGDWDHSGAVNAMATKFDSPSNCGDPQYTALKAVFGNDDKWHWLGYGLTPGRRLPDWMDGWQCQDPNKYQFTPKSYFGDVDGDGYLDRVSFTAISRPSGDPPNGPEIWIGHNRSVFFTAVDPNTLAIQPFAQRTPRTVEDQDLFDNEYQPRHGFLADVSGDGIPDLASRFVYVGGGALTSGKASAPPPAELWKLYYGRGDGTFERTSDTPPGLGENQYVHDVNGDSIADLLTLRFSVDPRPKLALDVVFGNVSGTKDSVHIDLTNDLVPGANYTLQFADLNGSGIDSIIFVGNGLHAMSLTGDNGPPEGQTPNQVVRPGVLKTITNDAGATTKFEYNTIQSITAGIPGHTASTPIPQPLHIVTRMTTSSKADVKVTGGPFVTEYQYKNAVYDKPQRRFLGFRELTTWQRGTSRDDDVLTITDFLISNCEGLKVNWCHPTDERPGEMPIGPLNGAPAMVYHYATTPSAPFVKHYRYRLQQLYTGMDNRTIRTAYAERVDTWFVDFSGGGSPIEATMADVVSDALTVTPPTRTFNTMTVSNGRRVHLASEAQRDGFGNVTSKTDHGMVEAGRDNPKDVPIVHTFENWLLPSGDGSRWNWRESDARTSGRHMRFEYDAAGRVTKTYTDLQGTLDLVRFHEDGRDVAPRPADASDDKINLFLSENQYDSFGNPILTRGPNGRCRRIKYDEGFTQLPIQTTVYKNGCGGSGLTTTATFDRGLELPTTTTAPNGATTTVEYDDFGRPVRVFEPNPGLPLISSGEPSVKMTYFESWRYPDKPNGFIRVERRDDDGSGARYRSTWTYLDPFGQTIASVREADPGAGDQAPYIVTGEVERDGLGRVVKRYEPRFSNFDPNAHLAPVPVLSTPSTSAIYDSLRGGHVPAVRTYGLDGQYTGKIEPSALEQTTYDATDLAPGATARPTKTLRDGHGRTVLTQRMTSQGGTEDTISTRVTYLPTGEVATVTRSHTASNDVYTRVMTYDSLGRLVQNAEPNTSTGFGTANQKAWRYGYNDAGDLVATSDARGCGKNLALDGMGRLISEVYSPCLRSHADYDVRPTSTFVYDEPEEGQEGNALFFAGRLAASYDRAQRTRYTYDGRGRTTQIARQVALVQRGGIFLEEEMDMVGAPAQDVSALQAGYTPRWYKTAFAYDEADRVIAHSMGMDVSEMQGNEVTAGGLTGKDLVTTSYTSRGLANHVAGSYGDLVTSKLADADGLVRAITYGDTAGTVASFDYNARRWLQRSLIRRNPPPIWGRSQSGYPKPSTSETAQTVLQDLHLDSEDSYDAVGNPLKVVDARITAEWPAGAKPMSTKQFAYDDRYRLRRVEYDTGDDVQVSPFDEEIDERDTRPMPEQKLGKRVKWQSFDFDWQGNLTKSDDDVHAFHDRSMGTMTYGTPSNGPNRVVAANAEKGHAKSTYDAAGNLTKLTLQKPGPERGTVDLEFSYEWDEVGRLARAKRATSSVARGIEFRYTYDAGGQRVIKSVQGPKTEERLYTIDVFPTLRLNEAHFISRDRDYERTEDTATAYLVSNGTALARVVHGDPGLPTIGPKKARVYFTMIDPLGSTSVVIDKATSELVERSTYQAFGAPETDYRPKRWQTFREDYRFTGKEDDIGVGLTYFGYRYYVAALGQWASADPLTVHGLGSDLNPYAYVAGSPQKLVDPNGLEFCEICYQAGNGGGPLMGWDPFGSPFRDAMKPFYERPGGIKGYLVARVPTGAGETDPPDLIGFRIKEYDYITAITVPNEDCPPGDACMDTVGTMVQRVKEVEPIYDAMRNGAGNRGWQDAGAGNREKRELSRSDWARRAAWDRTKRHLASSMSSGGAIPIGGVFAAAEQTAARLVIQSATATDAELTAASQVAKMGRGSVVIRDPIPGRATSDLLIEGAPYDIYSPTTGNANRIISAIANKNSQATGIVLDLRASPVDVGQLGNILGRVNGAGATNIQDIIILGR